MACHRQDVPQKAVFYIFLIHLAASASLLEEEEEEGGLCEAPKLLWDRLGNNRNIRISRIRDSSIIKVHGQMNKLLKFTDSQSGD